MQTYNDIMGYLEYIKSAFNYRYILNKDYSTITYTFVSSEQYEMDMDAAAISAVIDIENRTITLLGFNVLDATTTYEYSHVYNKLVLAGPTHYNKLITFPFDTLDETCKQTVIFAGNISRGDNEVIMDFTDNTGKTIRGIHYTLSQLTYIANYDFMTKLVLLKKAAEEFIAKYLDDAIYLQ